ncbi:hypothetical protein SDC9_166949 [bioreactor metagenome]|uniref:Uncharacterized protein n=1 Tax=bioreactor metagenome TaxID=1076179 RepID=A0A645FYF0_9ZZZZ
MRTVRLKSGDDLPGPVVVNVSHGIDDNKRGDDDPAV